ncbi:MAG: TetR/AcrR family transcriptional regulator [Spirochaetales bacterium]|nr:TetR/AcrR family transcriptional regulator [Spirochaetales bacterium]
MDKEKINTFHRESIIKASDELFREFGKEGTTITMISRLAQYSTATIYVYFKNKEEIFACLIFNTMQEFIKNLEKIISSKSDFEAKFFSICNLLVELQHNSPLYFEGMISHINMNFTDEDTPQIFKEIFDLGNQMNAVLMTIVDQAIADKIIPDNIDKLKLIFHLWGSLTGVIRMAKQKNDYFILNNVTQRSLLEFSFKNILNGIKYLGG